MAERMATDVSADAMKILKIFEEIFRRDKQIKADLTDPDEYLCDVFRRIKTTSKEKLVGLLAHRWQPASESVWTSVPSIH